MLRAVTANPLARSPEQLTSSGRFQQSSAPAGIQFARKARASAARQPQAGDSHAGPNTFPTLVVHDRYAPGTRRSQEAPSCNAMLRDLAVVLHLTSVVKQDIVRGRIAQGPRA